MKVDEIMSSPVLAIKPADPIARAKNLMLWHKVSRLIVMDKGKIIGILTMHDFAARLSVGSSVWRRRTIDNIPVFRAMHGGIISVSVGTDTIKAAALMLRHDISSLVVMDGADVAGIVTKTDFVRHFSKNLKSELKVRDVMSRDVVTVNRLHSIARVAEVMQEYGVRRVIVVDGNRPVGLISGRDIAFAQLERPEKGVRERRVRFTRRTERGGRKWARYVKYTALLTAEDIMRTKLIKIEPDANAARAASIMLKNNIGGIPVVEGEKLVGIVTKTDITKGITKMGV